ncbi:fibronectin type III domain-containing protein [Paenibacillus sp. TRM 82003]|nr:fibronectin type III domain-containing protein [Paenibacillus sp. TRM 82003]
MPNRHRSSRRSRNAARLLAAALTTTAILPSAAALPAQAATGTRVDLRVLVVTDGSVSVNALTTQLDREGVPYTSVDLRDGSRAAIGSPFLVDATTGAARYQAVVLPSADPAGLGEDEQEALAAYEARYGIRQVNAYVYPGTGTGALALSAGFLDGAAGTVTDAGRADGFSELSGAFPIDDFDTGVQEVYGYLAAADPALPAGDRVTPLLTATTGGVSGAVAWEYESGGREQLMVSAAYNDSMQWFNTVAHGVVSWMTRGVHLGHHRAYFDVQVDDVFLPDGRWSVTGNCTPGDDCVDPATATTDIRMTAADVQRLSAWQQENSFGLTMVFNGGGSEAAKAEGDGTDALTDAFMARKGEFTWVNHTFSHPYLGCIQIAPTVVGQPWHCATGADETPRQDAEIPGQEDGGVQWASQEFITGQLRDNIDWARTNALPGFDASELVTGEHSGLRTLPNQPQDNPFLAPALEAAGVTTIASDASREKDQRAVGAAVTVPRHPMNVYYNAGTYQDQIDEYNWYYTSRSNGGSGICEDNPATSTCITPLPAGTAAEAKASYDGYLKPLEVRNALRYVLADDPRSFYVHQSNLAEDGLVYPVVEGVLEEYRATHTADAPLVTLSLTGQARQLARSSAWREASADVTAYVDDEGVHVSGPAGTTVPLTLPGDARSTLALEDHGGQRSAWVSAPTTDTVVATLATDRGGYVGVPVTAPVPSPTVPVPSPTTPTAPVPSPTTPTAPVPSPTTPTAPVPSPTTPTAPVPSPSTPVPSPSTPVPSPSTPVPSPTAPVPSLPGAPRIGAATSGRLLDPGATATVRWDAPATGGEPVIGYRITATRLAPFGWPVATATLPTVYPATARSARVELPARGSLHRFTVQAVTAAGTGPASAASNAVFAW